MPAILTTILGFAFSGMMSSGMPAGRAEIAVVNLGSSAAASLYSMEK